MQDLEGYKLQMKKISIMEEVENTRNVGHRKLVRQTILPKILKRH